MRTRQPLHEQNFVGRRRGVRGNRLSRSRALARFFLFRPRFPLRALRLRLSLGANLRVARGGVVGTLELRRRV